MTDQENDTQQKPTLQLARDYVAKLHEISGAMAEGKQLKGTHTPLIFGRLFTSS